MTLLPSLVPRTALRRSAAPLIVALVALANPGLRAASAAPLETYLEFDGQGVLELPDRDELDLTGGAFTISAWIHPLGWGQNAQGRIFDHGGGSNGNLGWALHVTNDSSRDFPATLRMQINNDKSFDGVADRDAINLGVWQHVAVSLEAGSLRFYVDGVLVGTRTGVPTPLPRAAPARIGMRATDSNRGFAGAIDEVRIWNRALSQSEIQAQMDQTLAGNEPGLVAYYPLDEGAGQTAFDAGPNAIDANLGTSTGPDNEDPLWVVDTVGNLAPVVDAGADESIILPTDSLQLAGSASDDGLPAGTLALDWTTVGGPPDASFDDPGVLDPVATFPAAGTYVLRLTADDSELTASDDMQVVVEPEPVLSSIVVSPSAAILVPGEDRQFSALGFDQQGGGFPVAPSWSATGGSIDPTGLYTAAAATGSFSVTASDSGVSGQASVQITNVPPDPGVWPTAGWVSATPAEMGMDLSKLEQARDYALTGGGAGMITRGGVVVLEWGSRTSHYDLKSTTKSIGSLLLGLSVDDGLVSLDDPAGQHLSGFGTPPDSNALTGWLDDVTLHHLATQTAGFDEPGDFIAQLFEPGTTWAYTDGGVNWLADVLTSVHAQDLRGLLFDRILTPLGVGGSQLDWRDHASRPTLLDGVPRREFSAGISTDVDTLARVGYLVLREGQWEGAQLLPVSFVQELGRVSPTVDGLPVQNDTQSRFAQASSHYGLLWWNNADGSIPGLPGDATWAWGLGDSLIVVIPSLDIVASRAGNAWSGSRSPSYYQVLQPFLEPMVESVYVASGNQPPSVDAGANVSVTLPTNSVALNGIVGDDGNPGGTLSTLWSVVSAPGAVSFADETATSTTASFSAPGTYVLDLTADDGELSAGDSITIEILPEVDSTPPSVTLTAPSDGALVAGTVTVSATASDDEAVANVEFLLDGATLQLDQTAPYAIAWDTTLDADGPYTLTATARDPSGNSASTSIAVTVANGGGGPDETPPTVSLLSPADSSWLFGVINLIADAADDVAVASVEFFVDGSSVGQATGAPYRVAWNTRGLQETGYTISVVATDAAGNQASSSVNVTVDNGDQAPSPPYPYSDVITGLEWDDPDTMVREAQGSDGWAITWADDGEQYTAYGDGWGFRHEAPSKLSLGFAKILGPGNDYSGVNIWSPTGELPAGNGDSERKSSGMLMVDGTLYMFVRNADQNGKECQLVWSADHAETWEWGSWTIPELGHCALLNFGQNYAGARDGYVYMYSPNTPSGRFETDSAVLARVPKDRIRDRSAYEFVSGFDSNGDPTWSSNIAQREPIFEFPGGCNHMDVSYDAPLGRYLMVMRSRGYGGGRNQFSIYDAPEPWGPWTTVFYTERYFGEQLGNPRGGWDESQHFPTKWIDPDGKRFWFLSASFDSFAVLGGRFSVAESVNEAPVVDAGTDQTVTPPNDTVVLDGTVSDDGLPSGSLVTSWRAVSAPGPVVFGNATEIDTTAAFSLPGAYVLELSADDSDRSSADLVSVVYSAPTGDLQVNTSTTGQDLDPDGYTVALDGSQSQSIGIDGTVMFSGLLAGDHQIELSGVASNCTVSGGNPRTVNVTGGVAAITIFDVTCSAHAGQLISGISFDWSTYQELAPGSDNWPLTWCEDDHQYTSWGDGGGFGSTNGDGHVSLGFGRIEGDYPNFTGVNVWGGKDPSNVAQFEGKSTSILCLDGDLYAWRSSRGGAASLAWKQIIRSTDKAATWEEDIFPNSRLPGSVGAPGLPFFINYGQNYSANTDGYVYIYTIRIEDPTDWEVQKPGVVWLARASASGEAFANTANWEWLVGLSGGDPQWGTQANRVPVLEDPDGMMRSSALYIPGLDRYVMVTNHTARNLGNIAIWEAPEPWGPWNQVIKEFGWPGNDPNPPPDNHPRRTFAFGNFSPKWLSTNGRDCVFVWFRPDSWNSVSCHFEVNQ